MKNIVIITLLSLLFLQGCTGFLDTDPADRFSQETYWKTSDRALAALNGVYNALTTGQLYGGSKPL